MIGDKEILASLRHLGARGVPPTLRELADHLGYSSTSTVRYRLMKLEEKGKLVRQSGKPRSVVVVGGKR
jgi:repressor LexA